MPKRATAVKTRAAVSSSPIHAYVEKVASDDSIGLMEIRDTSTVSFITPSYTLWSSDTRNVRCDAAVEGRCYGHICAPHLQFSLANAKDALAKLVFPGEALRASVQRDTGYDLTTTPTAAGGISLSLP